MNVEYRSTFEAFPRNGGLHMSERKILSGSTDHGLYDIIRQFCFICLILNDFHLRWDKLSYYKTQGKVLMLHGYFVFAFFILKL